MFQVIILAKSHVHAPHAKWEALRERIDGRRSDGLAVNNALAFRIHRICAPEILREMVEDWSQAIVLIQSRQGSAC